MGVCLPTMKVEAMDAGGGAVVLSGPGRGGRSGGVVGLLLDGGEGGAPWGGVGVLAVDARCGGSPGANSPWPSI